MRVFLREKDCEISVGIQNTNNLRKLEAAVNKAEQAMQQDKLAYYSRNGQERQLKGLNEKLERTLTQKRDAEHFLRVLAPKYRSVYVVNLQRRQRAAQSSFRTSSRRSWTPPAAPSVPSSPLTATSM